MICLVHRIIPLVIISTIIISCGKNLILDKDFADIKDNQNEIPNSTSPKNANTRGVWSASQLPLNLKISQEFSQEEIELIMQMASNWEKSVGLQHKLFQFTKDVSTQKHYYDMDSYKDGELGIYPINHWFENIPERTLGLTQFFGYRMAKGTPQEYIQLTHADIFINTDNHVFTTDDQSQWSGYDLGAVVLHELGHFLGLGHTQDKPSVMGEYLSYMENPRYPSVLDQLKLKNNYQFMIQGMEVKNGNKQKGEFVRGVLYIKDL